MDARVPDDAVPWRQPGCPARSKPLKRDNNTVHIHPRDAEYGQQSSIGVNAAAAAAAVACGG